MKQDVIHAYCMQAFPKINVALKIGAKRGNLHTLQSRFCLVVGSLYDSMFIARTAFNHTLTICNKDTYYQEVVPINQHVRCFLYGRFDCKLEDNLIYKAYCILLQYANNTKLKPCTLHIMVEKHIPVGGGLGGGSVNAALTLLMLNELLSLHYDNTILHACAKKLGSDVAFFLMIYTQNSASIAPYFLTTLVMQKHILQDIAYTFNTQGILCPDIIESLQKKQTQDSLNFLSANVFGIGDDIQPFYEKLPNFLIHCNTIACNTAAVYKEFMRLKALQSNTTTQHTQTLESPINLQQDSLTLLQTHTKETLNDLYLPACNLYDLQPIAQALCATYQHVYFSGSGSSFFSIKQT